MTELGTLKIATRASPLALWQANYVKQLLQAQQPTLAIELALITTQGDLRLESSLAKIGGKGLFIKELEVALQEKRADLAVHSMKDMTAILPQDLMLGAFCPREDVRDAFISFTYPSLEDLPMGAKIGTSSLRRQSQLLRLRPDLQIHSLRGNVNTRLDKLKQGQFDAIILAAAGLIRLGLSDLITQYLSIDLMLPAVGQAIIGIECRLQDNHLQSLLAQINCPKATACITAERTMNQALGGSCTSPIAGLATEEKGLLSLQAKVLSPDGQQLLEAQAEASLAQADKLGKTVAEQLLKQGAKTLLL